MIIPPVFRIRNMILTGLSPVLLSLAAACTLDAPTYYAQKRVEVVQQDQHYEIETKKFDQEIARQIARNYARYGDGTVKVVVTYNAAEPANTAMMATDNAARIVSSLRKEGIDSVETEILPVYDSSASMSLFTYEGYVARAPEGCEDMALIDDSAHENYRGYALGCSMETYIAQQIARPKDLLGRDVISEETDARKRANAVEGYKWTAKNAILETPQTSQ